MAKNTKPKKAEAETAVEDVKVDATVETTEAADSSVENENTEEVKEDKSDVQAEEKVDSVEEAKSPEAETPIEKPAPAEAKKDVKVEKKESKKSDGKYSIKLAYGLNSSIEDKIKKTGFDFVEKDGAVYVGSFQTKEEAIAAYKVVVGKGLRGAVTD